LFVNVQIEWQVGMYFCNHFSSQKLLMSMLLLDLLLQCYACSPCVTYEIFYVAPLWCSSTLFIHALHVVPLCYSSSLFALLLHIAWPAPLNFWTAVFFNWIYWILSGVLRYLVDIVLTDVSHVEIWQNCVHRYLALDSF
jgi:hypothetical protein